MGYDCKLLVPEDRKTRSTIEDYYQYVSNRLEDLGRDEFPEYRLETAIERFEADGTFLLHERITRDAAPILSRSDAFQALCPDDKIVDGCYLEGMEIQKLIELLREVKRELQRERPDETNWELTFEGQPIVLFEYALENGYAVELTPS